MQIDPNNKPVAVGKVASFPPAARKAPGQADQIAFSESEALNSMFNQAPDVRPEKVQRARELIGRVDYPPRETINKIADLLAIGMGVPPEQ